MSSKETLTKPTESFFTRWAGAGFSCPRSKEEVKPVAPTRPDPCERWRKEELFVYRIGLLKTMLNMDWVILSKLYGITGICASSSRKHMQFLEGLGCIESRRIPGIPGLKGSPVHYRITDEGRRYYEQHREQFDNLQGRRGHKSFG